jgi:hypothetical protein
MVPDGECLDERQINDSTTDNNYDSTHDNPHTPHIYPFYAAPGNQMVSNSSSLCSSRGFY